MLCISFNPISVELSFQLLVLHSNSFFTSYETRDANMHINSNQEFASVILASQTLEPLAQDCGSVIEFGRDDANSFSASYKSQEANMHRNVKKKKRKKKKGSLVCKVFQTTAKLFRQEVVFSNVSDSQVIGASTTVDIAQSFRPMIELRRNGIHGCKDTCCHISTVYIFIECASA